MIESPAAARVSPEVALRLLSGRFLTQVLLTTKDLQLFSRLAEGPLNAAELRADLHLPEDRLRMFLDANVALGLMTKKEDVYQLAPVAESYLVPGKAGYLGGLIEHFQTNVYPAWENLTLAIKESKPQVAGENGSTDIFSKSQESEEQARIYMEAAHSLGFADGAALADGFDFSSYHQLLDIGGGSGALSLAITKRYSGLEAVVFELPKICVMTERYIAKAGVACRVRTIAGDAFEDTLPGHPDIILISHFIHAFGRKHCEGLLRKCYDALSPGGCLLLVDPLLNADHTGPITTLLTNLTLLTIAPAAEAATALDYRHWLSRGGFQDVFDKPLASIRHLVGGYKPR